MRYHYFDMPARYDAWKLDTPPRYDDADDDPDDCDDQNDDD